jgi:NADH-quinone oxidoreductase subunit E
MIPAELKKELEARVSSAVTPREAAVDVMKELQGHYGWLTDEGVEEAAGILGRRPVGKKVIHLCDSISCWTVGCETLMAHMAKRLGVEPGGTTADGMFTLLPCSCLGNCGNGPVMMLGDKIYDKLTPDEADRILEKEQG